MNYPRDIATQNLATTQPDQIHSSMTADMTQTYELVKLRLRERLMGIEEQPASELILPSQTGRLGVENVTHVSKASVAQDNLFPGPYYYPQGVQRVTNKWEGHELIHQESKNNNVQPPKRGRKQGLVTNTGASSQEKDMKQRKKPKKIMKTFEERIEELKAYKEKHGHFRVPQRSGESERLAHWCNSARRACRLFKRGKHTGGILVNEKRFQMLVDIGFQWEIQHSFITFEQRLCELIKFKDANGHCRVPRSGDTIDLGVWCTSIKKACLYFMEGRRCTVGVSERIDKDRLKKLQDVGLFHPEMS